MVSTALLDGACIVVSSAYCVEGICNYAATVDSTGVLNIPENGSAQCKPGHTLKNPERVYCHQGNWVNFPICELNPPASGYRADCVVNGANNLLGAYQQVYRDGSVVCRAGHSNVPQGTPYCTTIIGLVHWWHKIDKCVPTFHWLRESVYAIDRTGHVSVATIRSDCQKRNGTLPYSTLDLPLNGSDLAWGPNWAVFGDISIFYVDYGVISSRSYADNVYPANLMFLCIIECRVDEAQLNLLGYRSISKDLHVTCETGYQLHTLKEEVACGPDGIWKNLPRCIRNII
ncbi:uncharacterized protein LOC135827916 [Sycon ciliatum]|uniref:uncharacterized protein LOC135827916 n=1 Tax=Sycon ciliatum TaxID=27933 RepID=UPI0031F6572D